jgi:hypothetical protein
MIIKIEILVMSRMISTKGARFEKIKAAPFVYNCKKSIKISYFDHPFSRMHKGLSKIFGNKVHHNISMRLLKALYIKVLSRLILLYFVNVRFNLQKRWQHGVKFTPFPSIESVDSLTIVFDQRTI